MIYFIKDAKNISGDNQEYYREGQSYVLDGIKRVAGPDCVDGQICVPSGDKPDPLWYDLTEQFNGPVITYSATAKPVDEVRAIKLRQLAAYRYEIEVGGTVVNGITVPTDRQGRKDLRDARDALAEGILPSVMFKAPSGWVSLSNASDAAPLVAASAIHVNDCFAAEAIHSEAILGIQVMNAEGTEVDSEATVAAIATYDFKTGWPV